jgi:hypothetical protein
MTTRSLIFHKFADTWVITAKGLTVTGVEVSIAPVRVLSGTDNTGLAAAIDEQLRADRVVLPDRDPNERKAGPSIMAAALGLKSDRAFHRRARCFYLVQSTEQLCVHEWRRVRPSSFAGPPLWQRCFASTDVDKLALFLTTEADALADVDEDDAAESPG